MAYLLEYTCISKEYICMSIGIYMHMRSIPAHLLGLICNFTGAYLHIHWRLPTCLVDYTSVVYLHVNWGIPVYLL